MSEQPGPTAESPDAASATLLARVLTLPPGRVFRFGFFLALGLFAAYVLVQALGSLRSIIIILVVALFGALGLQPVIDWLIRRGLPRAVAAILVMVALLAAVAGFLWALVPLLIDQVTVFAENAPSYATRLRANPQVAQLDKQFGVIDKVTGMIASPDWITGALGGFMGASIAAAGLFASAGLTTVLLLFFTWSAPSIKDAIYEMAPASRRPRVRFLANEIFQRMGDYLLSMVLVVSLWGVGSFIVFNVVGLGKYSLALSLLTMMLTAIPAVGSFIAMALASLVALSVSPAAAVGVLAYFLVYQQVDAYVVQPRLFARSLRVPPALVILGVACGMTLLGVLGALLAIPFVASLLLLYREVIVPRLDAS